MPSFTPRSTWFFATLALAALLHGCASTPAPEPVEHYRGLQDKAAAAPSLLVVSACALRDEVGNDYFLIDEAETRARQIARESADYLRNQGMRLAAEPVLLMCGGYRPEAGEKLEFIQHRKAKDSVAAGTFPHLFDASPVIDDEDAQQLHSLFESAYLMQNSQVTRAGETPSRYRLTASHRALSRIRENTGASHVWLVSGRSLEISGGKVVTSAVLTSVLTMGLAASVPVGGKSDLAALVDLDDASIAWKKDVGSTGGITTASAGPNGLISTHTSRSEGVVGSPWAEAMFRPLLDPAKATAGAGIVSASAADVAP